ncbi:hypothetical protein [Cellulomonas sp.]|uniref:hypothetical protein n=1 Tax=Cellulomonas sp. TaxID=40001 RepID=UPI001B2D3568|nr:hypothetical protein [Cellulomonas sp.]MBO9553220.1 hypothetical protein [Cellulomonas sp.]
MAGIAIFFLLLGLVLSHFLVSPGKAAADAAPPVPGPITVPIERKTIANEVVMRGDVAYDDPVAVRLETGDVGGPAVVTGHVPMVGSVLEAGAVALEVNGRPVIVLPGDLPTYRTLRTGVSGPDVRQLRAALASLGIPAGDLASSTYDADVAEGVRALYRRVGYEPPLIDSDLIDAAKQARQELRAASDAVASAQRALASAAAGKPRSELIALDTAILVARATLSSVQAGCSAATPEEPCDEAGLLRAQGDLDAALAARQEAGTVDTSADSAALTSAQAALADAREAALEAENATLTPLPSSEVVFLASLPRRVDTVGAVRGGIVSGDVFTVSGANLEVRAKASGSDLELLQVGAIGSIEAPDGSDIRVTITQLGDVESGAAEEVEDKPSESPQESGANVVLGVTLQPELLGQLLGKNVRISVPVESTDGDVLAVPLAALTAGPGGQSRIELVRADGSTEIVDVQTGLAADGFAEVSAVDAELAAGDLVVVGAGAPGRGLGGTSATTNDGGKSAGGR